MFPYTDQTMNLTNIRLKEIAKEIAHDRLATAAVNAHQAAHQRHASKLGILYIAVCQWLHKWSQPTWAAVAKRG